MTPQQIVGLAVRLFAVWIGITAFQSVAIAQALASQANSKTTWPAYLFAALYLGAAILLWLFPMAIAHKLVPRSKFEDRLTLSARQAAVVACVVIGLLVVVFRALPPLTAYVSLATYWIGGGQPISTMPADRHIDAIVGVMQLVVGAFLVARAQTLASRFVPELA